MPTLVQPLFDGPLDIVGDVHGEMDALRALLSHLNYDSQGRHADGRRLIFVGDLTDRGPDSPAVIEFVSRMIDSGEAQCVLGNHDLNLLLEHRKADNRWFYGEAMVREGETVPQKLADEPTRQLTLGLFRRLPIALERGDLRIVHACWNERMIEIARKSSDARELYMAYREEVESTFPDLELDDTDKSLRHQNRNPVKRLTSGPEERVVEAFEASGKVRNERRVQWWRDYRGTFCVFGHYSIPHGEPRGN
jgi:hypothetical protein